MNKMLYPNCERLDFSIDNIESAVNRSGNQFVGNFTGLQLTTAFQPIYSVAHRRPVGHEALLRAFSPLGPVAPQVVFDTIQAESEAIFLDRLCRNLHLRNFLSMADDTSWLFLNINPQVVVNGKRYGAYFADLLARYDFPAHRIVVEIVERAIGDETMLAEAVGYYKDLGCLVAIDDFGAGHSNFDRIWRIRPNIVKIDRTIIVQAAASRRISRIMPNLVSLIHESGSLALIEGVETEDEALIALDSGIDFVQGYYFARPENRLAPADQANQTMIHLCAKFHEYSEKEVANYHRELDGYIDIFQEAARQIAVGIEPHLACAVILSQTKTERCFVLDQNGKQLGANIVSSANLIKNDPRFRPVAKSEGAMWARRHYFRRAISQPGQVQVTRPYLSVARANMCITLSIAIQAGDDPMVLCCDLDWADA